MTEPPRNRRPDEIYRRLRRKLGRDRIFLLASALSFNAFVALIPLVVLAGALLGLFIGSSPEAEATVRSILRRVLPVVPGVVGTLLATLEEDRAWIGLVGGVGLVWAATRFFTSLREVLEIVFEIPAEQRFGYVRGKAHDVGMVGLAGLLFVVTFAVTTALHAARELGARIVGDRLSEVGWLASVASYGLGLLVTIAMFYVVYRLTTSERIPRFDAGLAAVFSGVLFEIAKVALVVYLGRWERVTLYGSFTSGVALALWIYYTCLVVILGAEIASARRAANAS